MPTADDDVPVATRVVPRADTGWHEEEKSQRGENGASHGSSPGGVRRGGRSTPPFGPNASARLNTSIGATTT